MGERLEWRWWASPASHAGNWLSAWGSTQLETRFVIQRAFTHSLWLNLSSSALLLTLPREMLRTTTAAVLHPVGIHTLPGKPISGLTACHRPCVRVCACVRTKGVISLSLRGGWCVRGGGRATSCSEVSLPRVRVTAHWEGAHCSSQASLPSKAVYIQGEARPGCW